MKPKIKKSKPREPQFASARIAQPQMKRLKKLMREDPKFKGPPKWTITDLLTLAVEEFVNRAGY